MLSKVCDIDVFRVGKRTRRWSDIELYPKDYTSSHLIYPNKQITAMCRRCGASSPGTSWWQRGTVGLVAADESSTGAVRERAIAAEGRNLLAVREVYLAPFRSCAPRISRPYEIPIVKDSSSDR
jgi:hypothetical protein